MFPRLLPLILVAGLLLTGCSAFDRLRDTPGGSGAELEDVVALVPKDERLNSKFVRAGVEALVGGALKGMLRAVDIEPPKLHDVGPLLVEHRAKFSGNVGERLARAAEISRRLRRERELAFYGDIDFVPTEQYSAADGTRAYEEAAWIVALAEEVIGQLPG